MHGAEKAMMRMTGDIWGKFFHIYADQINR